MRVYSTKALLWSFCKTHQEKLIIQTSCHLRGSFVVGFTAYYQNAEFPTMNIHNAVLDYVFHRLLENNKDVIHCHKKCMLHKNTRFYFEIQTINEIINVAANYKDTYY